MPHPPLVQPALTRIFRQSIKTLLWLAYEPLEHFLLYVPLDLFDDCFSCVALHSSVTQAGISACLIGNLLLSLIPGSDDHQFNPELGNTIFDSGRRLKLFNTLSITTTGLEHLFLDCAFCFFWAPWFPWLCDTMIRGHPLIAAVLHSISLTKNSVWYPSSDSFSSAIPPASHRQQK